MGVSVEVPATPTPRDGSRRRPAPDQRADRPLAPSVPRRRRASWIIALLGLLGVVLPVLIASHYGAMGIPRSDDWSYLLTLFRWVDSGAALVQRLGVDDARRPDRDRRADRRDQWTAASPRSSSSPR